MSIIQGTSKAAGGAGYEIDQSVRFDNVDGIDGGGAQMYRLALTGTPTNDKKATISAWVKRAALGFNQTIAYSGDPNGSTYEGIRFNTDDTLLFSGATSVYTLTTTQVFRDVGAWYHIVAEIDTANGTSADRANLYVNGEKVTSFSTATYPALNRVTNWTASSASIAHTWGTNGIPAAGPSSQLFAGYMAEMYVLDGEKAGATAFGEFNDSGVWIPTAYSGAFGNNGYYMTGETASALGDDFSGNGLDFTTVALATTDQMLDTPTVNHTTLNPNQKFSQFTLSEGNLKAQNGSTWDRGVAATQSVSSGKWYFEATFTKTSTSGIDTGWASLHGWDGGSTLVANSDNSYIFVHNGNKWIDGTTSSYGTALTTGDVIMCAFDLDNGNLFFGQDGVWENSATVGEIEAGTGTNALSSTIPAGLYTPIGYWSTGTSSSNAYTEFNFGQSAFAHTPPSGFLALNTANLATPSITDGSAHFQPTIYTGNGSTLEVNQSGNSTFQPDWVWGKRRNGAESHALFDAVRGTTKIIYSNLTNAETTNSGLTAFDADGFTIGSSATLNTNTGTYVAWQWKANGSGSSNTDGSITSTVSANTTSGFSISTYTGNATVGATVGHGLGIAPKVVIVKSRSNAESWIFGHDSVGWTKAMYMQSTVAGYTLDIYWNNTAPTSSVVTLHDHAVTNGSGATYVMYAFAEIPGYSSFGSYTGNGSTDGPFVYTGFRPSFVLCKNTINAGNDWPIDDAARSPFNPDKARLWADLSTAENTGSVTLDLLSNGFKIRTSNGEQNTSGSTHMYMAFAENPFGGDGVAPATAR